MGGQESLHLLEAIFMVSKPNNWLMSSKSLSAAGQVTPQQNNQSFYLPKRPQMSWETYKGKKLPRITFWGSGAGQQTHLFIFQREQQQNGAKELIFWFDESKHTPDPATNPPAKLCHS